MNTCRPGRWRTCWRVGPPATAAGISSTRWWCWAGGAAPWRPLCGAGAAATGYALLSGDRIGHDTSGLARRAYLTRLAATAVRGRAGRITEAGVEWLDESGARSVLPAGSIVVAEPLRPAVPAALAPRGGGADGGPNAAGVHTVRIGDARSPRTIGDAIAEARQVVEALPALAG